MSNTQENCKECGHENPKKFMGVEYTSHAPNCSQLTIGQAVMELAVMGVKSTTQEKSKCCDAVRFTDWDDESNSCSSCGRPFTSQEVVDSTESFKERWARFLEFRTNLRLLPNNEYDDLKYFISSEREKVRQEERERITQKIKEANPIISGQNRDIEEFGANKMKEVILILINKQ